MTIHRVILRAAALLVPRQERAEWLAEWTSELWYALAARRHHSREAMEFCLGAFPDAFCLRRLSESRFLESPMQLMILLAALAGAGILFTIHLMPQIRILPHVLVVAIALLVLPAITSLTWPGRRWMFFTGKIVFLGTIVFCGAIAVMAVAAPIASPLMMAGYVLAFRWALIDQRRRCPVCLRVLANPIRIGESSRTLLAWYGTELICAKGHGVLHVPEVRTSSYRTERWLPLDPCLK